nr:F0F1 ATP synthase subunit B [uncultured Blautia sp.]
MIKIDINLVFTIINLIVLYLLMKKFLFGPIIAVMDKRKAMIDEQFASAEQTRGEADELKGRYEDALKSAKDESFRIVEQAKGEAKAQADNIVKNANVQADEILAKARKNIENEQEAAMKAMEGKVAELAMDAASRIMGKKNDEAQDMSLYDQFLEGAGDPHDRDVH